MKKLLTSLNKRSNGHNNGPVPTNGTPEGDAVAGVIRFCESGGPNSSGDDVLHLPGIVEAAESSPSAAREAALQIRKFLSKENYERPPVQYNAIMLVRILADNPGPTFTRNLDAKFTAAVKELLKLSRDPGLQQLARETLDTFETEKAADEGLAPLREMWAKEKEKSARVYGSMPAMQRTPDPALEDINRQHNYFARNHRIRGLPPVQELAGRIEEAKTSAKLLLQVVRSTPASEVLDNELIKEFAERCQSASRSIQGYIHADNPPPDDDTLLTLIETNDQLTLAMSKHQRAVLQARKSLSSLAAPSPAVAPQPLALVAPVEDQNNLDPFRDDSQAIPPTLQAPLSATVPDEMQQQQNQSYPQGQYTYSQGRANPASYSVDRYQPSPYMAIETHAHHPFHPGYTQAQNDHNPFSAAAAVDNVENVESAAAPPFSAETSRHAPPVPSQATSSYVQRQHSAVANTTMRGAVGSG